MHGKLSYLSAYKKKVINIFFWRYSKNITNFLFWVLFWNIVKILWTCYFEYIARSCPLIIIVSPCGKLWCPKYWNQLVGNFLVYLHVKYKIQYNIFFSEDIAKILPTFYFGYFLKYCKDITILLLWVLWECLIKSISNDSITLKETLMSKVLKWTYKKLVYL